MTAPTRGGDAVTVVLTRRVPRERHDAMRALLARASAVASTFPGHQGATVRGPDGDVFAVVFRFTDAGTLHAWETSPERHAIMAQADALGGPAEEVALTGLEAFFRPAGAAGMPPRWKMALLTWAVAFPTAQSLAAVARRAPLSTPARGALVTGGMVLLLTYVLMPAATRATARWLDRGR